MTLSICFLNLSSPECEASRIVERLRRARGKISMDINLGRYRNMRRRQTDMISKRDKSTFGQRDFSKNADTAEMSKKLYQNEREKIVEDCQDQPTKLVSCLTNCANCAKQWRFGVYLGRECANECMNHKKNPVETIDPNCDRIEYLKS